MKKTIKNKIFLFFSLITILFSCKSNNEKNIEKNIQEIIKQDSVIKKIDTTFIIGNKKNEISLEIINEKDEFIVYKLYSDEGVVYDSVPNTFIKIKYNSKVLYFKKKELEKMSKDFYDFYTKSLFLNAEFYKLSENKIIFKIFFGIFDSDQDVIVYLSINENKIISFKY